MGHFNRLTFPFLMSCLSVLAHAGPEKVAGCLEKGNDW